MPAFRWQIVWRGVVFMENRPEMKTIVAGIERSKTLHRLSSVVSRLAGFPMVESLSIPLTIELADVVDFADCRACLDESGLETFPLRHRLRRLIEENHVWVARNDENRVIGTIGFDASLCRGSLFAQFMGVRSDFKHLGVASALLRHCMEFARQRNLGHLIADVPSDNSVMASTLSSCGFRQINASRTDCHAGRLTIESHLWGLRLAF
jgi:GNAT superfamily N-acetyltransferase